jgi:hypothetical protein
MEHPIAGHSAHLSLSYEMIVYLLFDFSFTIQLNHFRSKYGRSFGGPPPQSPWYNIYSGTSRNDTGDKKCGVRFRKQRYLTRLRLASSERTRKTSSPCPNVSHRTRKDTRAILPSPEESMSTGETIFPRIVQHFLYN